MQLRLVQVDAFTDTVLSGNPAAVCPLESWLDDATMQAIGNENNLSETAFFVPKDDAYELRWFTPNSEVDLCGHATLATGWFVLNELQPDAASAHFDTKSGRLTVTRAGEELAMDFPSQPAAPCDPPAPLVEGFGTAPAAVLGGVDYMAVFENAETVAKLAPDLTAFCRLDRRGVIATAPGDDTDYVLRFFAPKNAVPEDPVTGSAQTALAPYWAERLGKPKMSVRQLSARGGRMTCEHTGERVTIAGQAVRYMDATITI